MSEQINATNFLNTKQLMSISEGIKGVSEENNASVFSEVKSLDTNKNKTIDNNESVVSKIINLGNKILNKLASMLGISTDKPVENSRMETFEDAKKDSVIADYFEPYAVAGNSVIDSNAIEEGSLDDMVTNDNIKYLFNSIKQEKLSQGVKIVSKSKNQILFSDGTELMIRKNRTEGYSIMYNRVAEDGSKSYAEMSVYGKDQNEFEVQITTSDGNGPSEELLKSLQIRVPERDSDIYGKAYTYDEAGMQIIRENDNRESYAVRFSYSKESYKGNTEYGVERSAIYSSDHTISKKGINNSELQSKVVLQNYEEERFL